MKATGIAIILILLMSLAIPISAAPFDPTPIPTIIANSSIDYGVVPAIDIINSTGLVDWGFYMMMDRNTTTPWQFPIIGFAYDIMLPFTGAFAGLSGYGSIVYLILYGIFFMMLWRNSGKITLPALMGCIVSGAWALLLPESAIPWALMLLCAAVASQLMTFFAKE
jgi:hypothetical protein